jgi:hypothetical protein
MCGKENGTTKLGKLRMKFKKFIGLCPTCERVCLQIEEPDGWYCCSNCTWIWEPKEDEPDYVYQCPTCKGRSKFSYPLENGDRVACVTCKTDYVLGEREKMDAVCLYDHDHNWSSYGPGRKSCVRCWIVVASDEEETMETVDHPAHYNPGTYEAINVIEAWDLGFNLGNAVKYIARAGKKGDKIEDLKKAIWYLQREVAYSKWEKHSERVWLDPFESQNVK